MKLIKKIYTILVLLFNVLIRRRHYKLSFKAECEGTVDNPRLVKLWYYDFKHWGFDHHNLLMVSGADTLCEQYAGGEDNVTVDVLASKKLLGDFGVKEGYDHYLIEELPATFSWLDRIAFGRNYNEQGCKDWTKQRHFWICPVTLFVLGRYPKHIYIKKQ